MKLGPHVLNTTGPSLEWARRASIVKAVGSVDALRVAPDSAIRIYRRWFPTQPLDNWRAVDAILEGLGGYRHPNLICELYNEEHQRLGAGLEHYVPWTAEATRRLHAEGLKVAGFSFSTGVPNETDWQFIQSCGYAGVDALSLHAYHGNQGLTLFNALRHRLVHQWTGGDHPPILITECGRDAVEGGGWGWHNCGITAEQYVAELRAFDMELQSDSYVRGATVFTAGPSPDWANFSTDEISHLLTEEEPLALKDQFPDVYATWVAAGGDPEQSFRAHLMGIGLLPAGKAEAIALADSLKGTAEQIKNIVAQLPN